MAASGEEAPSRNSEESGGSADAGESGQTGESGEGEGGNGEGEGSPPPRPGRPGRAGAWLGGLALLLALAIGGLGGYAYWRVQTELSGLRARLTESESERSQLRSKVNQLGKQLGRLSDHQEGLGGRADDLAKRMDSLREATDDLLARIKGGPTYWRLERVETLLLAASRVARLEEDTEAAYRALAEADRILRQLNDPAWLDAREAIQQAMTRLEQTPDPDIPGIALRLSSLEEAALDLPLKSRERSSLGSPETQDGALSREPRTLWGTIKSAASDFWGDLKSLVRLRRTEERIEPLLPPDRAAYLRHNLVLTLQLAKIAALRGNGRVYTDALGRARDWTLRFFDMDSDQGSAMAQTLKELKKRKVDAEVPELEKPLQVFRRIRDRRGE